MEFIKDVLHLAPDTWTKDFLYINKRYILVDIEGNSDEYKDVVSHFRENSTEKEGPLIVQRVQHPFAFARYNIHKEALIKSGKTFEENIIYQNIVEDKIPDYLDYNCDQRRSGSALNETHYVRQKIIEDNYFGNRDSYTYPEYVIKTSGKNE